MRQWVISFLLQLLFKFLTSEGVKHAAEKVIQELCKRFGWKYDPNVIEDLFNQKSKE